MRSAAAQPEPGSKRTLTFAAETAALADLGAFVRDACCAHPQVILLELAVTEIAVNAIKHGGASHCQLEVWEGADGLELLFSDDGAPFDLTAAAAKPMGELRESGYGAGIVQKAATQLRYAYRDGWNTLALTFAY